MNLQERRQMMEQDTRFDEGILTEVAIDDTWITLEWNESGDPTSLSYITSIKKSEMMEEGTPEVGQTIRCYGKGWGYQVTGVSVDGVMYRYNTEQEMMDKLDQQIQKRKDEAKQEYFDRQQEYEDRIDALPEVFQQKLRGHMSRLERYAYDVLSYDLFVSEEAIKLAEWAKTPEKIQEYYGLTYEEQQEMFPLSKGHSGNTFGATCNQAQIYLTQPELIPRWHSALHGLSGCEECGCWAAYEGREDA